MTPRELELFFAACRAELEVAGLRFGEITYGEVKAIVNTSADELIFDVSEADRDWTARRLTKYLKDHGNDLT